MPDPQTVDPEDRPVLRAGMEGKWVSLLQQRLAERGYPIEADGDFGPRTTRAVCQFQDANALGADGIVGKATWSKLEEEPGYGAKDYLESRKERLFGILAATPGLDPRRALVLRVAIDQLGLRETDRSGKPAGTNGGAELADIVDEGGDGFPPSAYYQYHRSSNTTEMPPWCAIFVCWCMKKALRLSSWKEIPVFGTWQGWVHGMEQSAIAQGVFVRPDEIDFAKPEQYVGGVYTMLRSESGSDEKEKKSTKTGHTGFVVGFQDGKIVTFDGNVSNQAKEMMREIGSINGIVCW